MDKRFAITCKGTETIISILLLLTLWAHILSSHAQTVHTVLIEGMQFKPPSLLVKRGDTIVWKNADLVPHTVTASDKSFDSEPIEASGTWSLHVQTPGEITYVCTIHPLMKGKIAVE